MDEKTLCRSLLRVVDSIPSTAPWGVVECGSDCVFVHDRRDEATTMLMESVASQFGEVIAIESVPSDHDERGPLLGCLVRVTGAADEIAGRLRASYAIATTPSSDTDDHGPF